MGEGELTGSFGGFGLAKARAKKFAGLGGSQPVDNDNEESWRAKTIPAVIPALENTFKTGQGKTTGPRVPGMFIPAATATDPLKAEDKFEAGVDAKKVADNLVFGLNVLRQAHPGPVGAPREGNAAPVAAPSVLPTRDVDVDAADAADGAPRRPPLDEREQYQEDVAALPDQPDLDAYESMPVEHFGVALLRGMGWDPSQEDEKRAAVEHVKRPHRLGLGATAAIPVASTSGAAGGAGSGQPGGKDRRGGEVYYKNGVQKHVRVVGEMTTVQDMPGAHPGKRMRVVGGREEGLMCLVQHVLPKDRGSKSQMAVVVLLPSEEIVTVKCMHLADPAPVLGSGSARGRGRDDEPLVPPPKRARVDEDHRDHRDRDTRDREQGQEWDDRYRCHTRDRESRDARDARDSRKSRDTRDRDRDRNWEDRDMRDKRDRGPSSSTRPRASMSHPWVCSGIRVRIVDKHLSRGKAYLKKGVILDVPAPGVAEIELEDGRRLSGVVQAALETVVPKRDQTRVMVVRGEKAGRVAVMLRKNVETNAAAIQEVDEEEIVRVSLDDISELA